MSEDIKQAVDGLMTAFEEFKTTNDTRLKEIETKGVADPVTLGKARQDREDAERVMRI